MNLKLNEPVLRGELRLAQESFLTTVGDNTKKLMAAIPNFVQALRASSDDLTASQVQAQELSQKRVYGPEDRAFMKMVDEVPYQSLRELGAKSPEGLTGTYLQALAQLQLAADMAIRVKSEVLSVQATFLARVVSDPHALTSGMSFAGEWTRLVKEYESEDETLQKLFSGPDGKRLKVGDVVSRNKDWDEVLDRARHLQESLKRINVTEYKTLVNQCAEYLDLIAERLQTFADDATSRQIAQSISQGSFLMAEAVRFVCGTYYRSLQVVNSIDATKAHMLASMGR